MKNTNTLKERYRLFCKEDGGKLRITELEISQKDLLLLLSKQDRLLDMLKKEAYITPNGAVLSLVN